MEISIIIVSWNTKEYLGQCLISLFENFPESEADVWVVDNASTDGSAQMVKDCFPQVHLIENEQNVGFARANNQAINKCRGRYILLLNPDTEVRPRALDYLLEFMMTHPKIGATGSKLLNPNGTLQPSCFPLPTLSRELWRLFHLDKVRSFGTYGMESWDTNNPREVEVIQGACMLLNREALRQVGLLDEDYFIYTEEIDLCHRLMESGWKLFWVPRSQIVHYGGQSTQLVAAEMFLNLYRTKLQYFRKHHGRQAGFAYKLIIFCASLTRIAISPLSWVKQSSERKKYQELTGHYLRLLVTLPGM